MTNGEKLRRVNSTSKARVYPYGEVWTEGSPPDYTEQILVEDLRVEEELIEVASGILDDLWKQRERIEHLIKTTHSTDTLTKLWNNYDSITNTILRVMERYRIC